MSEKDKEKSVTEKDKETSKGYSKLNLAYTAPKAGMDGLLKEDIQAIIEKLQSNTSYYLRQEEKKDIK